MVGCAAPIAPAAGTPTAIPSRYPCLICGHFLLPVGGATESTGTTTVMCRHIKLQRWHIKREHSHRARDVRADQPKVPAQHPCRASGSTVSAGTATVMGAWIGRVSSVRRRSPDRADGVDRTVHAPSKRFLRPPVGRRARSGDLRTTECQNAENRVRRDATHRVSRGNRPPNLTTL